MGDKARTHRSTSLQECRIATSRIGKSQADFPFQPAVPQQMRIERAFDDRQAQPRRELVFQLFPHKFGVRFFVFRGLGLELEFEEFKSL